MGLFSNRKTVFVDSDVLVVGGGSGLGAMVVQAAAIGDVTKKSSSLKKRI